MKTMYRDLSDVRCHNCSMFGNYRRNCPNRQNSSIRADSISNNHTDNSKRAVDNRRKVAEEVFGVDITKLPLIVTPTTAPSIIKEMEMLT